MFESPLVQRCLQLVVMLDQRHRWNLTIKERADYATTIASYAAEIDQLTDSKLLTMLQNYHAEHRLVEALIDAEHPAHGACWEDWCQHTRRILCARASSQYRSEQQAVNLDDLVQEAMLDIWRGLSNFRYNSQFKTWVFTIVVNCITRQHRARNTKKRGENKPTTSLDALSAGDDLVCDEVHAIPEQVACDHLLLDLLHTVLAQQSDERLTLIFDLWANEHYTLQRIGKRINLSAARVHTLLKETQALLRSELVRQGWVEEHALPLLEAAVV